MTVEIAPNVYMIGARGANVYLLTSDQGLTLIDSGTSGEADKIASQMEETGHSLSDIRTIVLTHAHSDHTGCAAELARRSGAQVLAHRDDVPYIEQEARLPYTSLLSRLLIGLTDLLMGAPPCPVSRALHDGDTVAALGGLQVIHVPGHTPGSIALHQPEQQILFCGDMFFHNNAGTRMRVAPAIVSVDRAQTLESARKLAALSVETLCAGHGAPILTQGSERIRELVG